MTERVPPSPRVQAPWLLLALAVLLFVPLFIFRQAGPLDFWSWMSLNQVILIGSAVALDPGYRAAVAADLRSNRLRKIVAGLVSAAVLYGVFFLGNALSRKLFPFADGQISSVYQFRGGASVFRIALLLGLVIGPGEELFWRAYVQRAMSLRYTPRAGLLIATGLYAAIHLGSGNPLLILAALICGLAWGWLYLRFRSPLLNVISHTAWDLAVFVWFPFVR